VRKQSDNKPKHETLSSDRVEDNKEEVHIKLVSKQSSDNKVTPQKKLSTESKGNLAGAQVEVTEEDKFSGSPNKEQPVGSNEVTERIPIDEEKKNENPQEPHKHVETKTSTNEANTKVESKTVASKDDIVRRIDINNAHRDSNLSSKIKENDEKSKTGVHATDKRGGCSKCIIV